MTAPQPPKRGPGRPHKLASPVPAIDDGLEDRLRSNIGRAVTAAERRLDDYEQLDDPSPEQTSNVMKVAESCGVLLGHVRRHTESVRNAGRKLSLPVVTSWLREQSADVRAQIFDEFSDETKTRSVLG